MIKDYRGMLSCEVIFSVGSFKIAASEVGLRAGFDRVGVSFYFPAHWDTFFYFGIMPVYDICWAIQVGPISIDIPRSY
jgi:hypothetical protein